jgi:hypothetical protein
LFFGGVCHDENRIAAHAKLVEIAEDDISHTFWRLARSYRHHDAKQLDHIHAVAVEDGTGDGQTPLWQTTAQRILGGSVAMSESSQKEPAPEDRYLKKMAGIMKTGTHRERAGALLLRIKARPPELEELSRTLEKAEEDGVYRFYHGSYKVFYLQRPVKKAFALIKEIGGEADPPHFGYARIVEAGTAHDFQEERTNANWDMETKPILEAFWHTKYFINMMVKYAKELETVEMPLDYGMAAVLYLFELR